MLRERLRRETSAQHERLESRLDFGRASGDQDHYLRLLQAFHGFYAPLEASLPAYGDDPEQWIDGFDRRKAPLLTQDLKGFGLKPDEIRVLPCFLPCGQEDVASFQLGCMYVLEGSTLGGQQILKRLQPHWPHAFFESYGMSVGKAWRTFCAALANVDSQTADLDLQGSVSPDRVIGAARETFDHLDQWFASQGI